MGGAIRARNRSSGSMTRTLPIDSIAITQFVSVYSWKTRRTPRPALGEHKNVNRSCPYYSVAKRLVPVFRKFESQLPIHLEPTILLVWDTILSVIKIYSSGVAISSAPVTGLQPHTRPVYHYHICSGLSRVPSERPARRTGPSDPINKCMDLLRNRDVHIHITYAQSSSMYTPFPEQKV
jgi:hypothetical protein